MTHTNTRPGLLRQLMVVLYDLLLLLSVWFVAAAIPVMLNAGEAIESGNPLFVFYLLLVGLLFYGWFWTHGGQTLGMRAWKVYVISDDGQPVSWKQAGIRYLVALFSWSFFGLGFFWQWLGQEKRSWHDVISKTRLIVVKTANPSSTT